MTQSAKPPEPLVNASHGHLSVYVEGAHPAAVPFLFEEQSKRLGISVVLSFLFDAAFLALIVFLSRLPIKSNGFTLVPETPPNSIIWLNQPGPGGGGGGGGNQMKEPPKKAELPGRDKISVPVAKPVELEIPKETKTEPEPVQQLTIPALTLASDTQNMPGVLDALSLGPPPTLSQGSGVGGGSGTGTGTGVGSGSGSGLGAGSGGGTGGGVYRLGSGIISPVPLTIPKPAYTAEAMRARIQGKALVGCVVQTTGVCSDIELLHSLDPRFGLDNEALRSVRLWRFKPGLRFGQPVPVYITIEVEFALR